MSVKSGPPQNADDIPFDLKHYPHIIYGGSILKLKQELERRIRWCIESPSTTGNLAAEKLEFYVLGRRIDDGDIISIFTGLKSKAIEDMVDQGNGIIHKIVTLNSFTDTVFPFELKLAIHNISNRIYQGSGNDLGLIVPAEFKIRDIEGGFVEEEEGLSIQLPDGRLLHTWGPMKRILPDGWEALQVMVQVAKGEYMFEREFPIVIRMFTELGPKDITFKIKFE